MHLLTCPPHHPEIQGCSPQIVTNKSTNPLIQNNFALKKLEVGLVGLERNDIAEPSQSTFEVGCGAGLVDLV